jgi:hypothetical protein
VITGALAGTAVTNSQGVFSVGALSPGQYIVCAEVSTPGLLDPCHWAASAPNVTVTAGATTAGVTVTMAAGAVVPIHISDPPACQPQLNLVTMGTFFSLSLLVEQVLQLRLQSAEAGAEGYRGGLAFFSAINSFVRFAICSIIVGCFWRGVPRGWSRPCKRACSVAAVFTRARYSSNSVPSCFDIVTTQRLPYLGGCSFQ